MSQNHNIVSAAEDLIQEHFELDPSLEQVIWIDSDKTTEIRLLEINPETPATGSVLAFYFPPDEEFPYAMHLAEIKPDEWQKILKNEIPLPNGWTLDNHKVYPRKIAPQNHNLISAAERWTLDNDKIYSRKIVLQNHNVVSAAESLIQLQFELEPRLEQVIWINPDMTTGIRLLEIDPETFSTGSVTAFYFPPYEEFPYATDIAVITPDEWQKILHHEIPLPKNWTLVNHKIYSRETVTV